MLVERQLKLLEHLVEEHITTGQPVASKLLADQYPEQLSPATIRNELAELEELGYIFQPHTSAGRVPTEKAYRVYINQPQNTKATITGQEQQVLGRAAHADGGDSESAVKELAKVLAACAHEAVFIAFADDAVFYTGLSHLFDKPEFHNPLAVITMSRILDHFDEAISELYRNQNNAAPSEHIAVSLGKANPFGTDCGTVWAQIGGGHSVRMIGLFGPMRMPYRNHMARLQFLQTMIV